MLVFIIKDVDTGACRVFKTRKNAIDTMYHKCQEWGAILYTSIWEKVGKYYQYRSLDKICKTDEQKLNFLYQSSAAELCHIFYAYWNFQECEIEDEEV